MIEEFRLYKDNRCYRKDGTVYQGAIYEISNFGRVKMNGELIELKPNNHGYLGCSVGLVHRMVAEIFINNEENKPCVDHIDTDKNNNNVENLRWVTYTENMLNPITRKHNSEMQTWQKGENNPMHGCKRSEEWKKHQSEIMKGNKANLGKVFSDEWRNNISKARKGSHLSPESLEKRREKMREKKLTIF